MEVPRSQFVKEYMGVRGEVFTEELIRSAWRKAGLWPVNPYKFTDKDFAPSKLMSYAACLPPGYPECPDAPDILRFVPGDDENGVMGEEGGEGEMLMDVDEEMGGGDEGMNGGDRNDEVDGVDDEDDETEEEMDDGGDDRTLEPIIVDDREEEPVGEVSEDESRAGEADTLSDAGHSLRYEGESYLSKRLTLTHLHSSAPAPPTLACDHESARRIADLEAEVRSLRSQLETANSQLETALAHSVCAGWEIRSLKERLNSKTNTKKRKVQVNAQYISSADAIRILDERDREEAEKKQKEEEAQAAKRAKDDQRKQQREVGGITFAGSLNSKTRDDLLDITFALRLTGSDSNTPETKATLISMINTHLDANPHLASDSACAGLFLSRSRGRKRNDDNAPPSAIHPPTFIPPGLPRQPLSSNFSGNTPESTPEPPMVLFSELSHSGRFLQSISSTPPDFSLPSPSSFMPFSRYPPSFPPTDPQSLPPSYFPPPLSPWLADR